MAPLVLVAFRMYMPFVTIFFAGTVLALDSERDVVPFVLVQFVRWQWYDLLVSPVTQFQGHGFFRIDFG